MSRRGATRLPYYEALGVEATATQEEIRRAYRKLAMRWHPDKNPDNVSEAEAQFKFIAEAFETLGDELRRADYDRGGAAAPSHSDDFGDASASGTSGGVYGDPRQRYGGGGGFYAHAVDPFEIFNAFFGGRGGGDPFATFMDDDFFAPQQPRFHHGSDPFFGNGGGGAFAGAFGGAHLPSLHAQLQQQQAAMQQQSHYGGSMGGMGGGFASVSTSSTTTVVNGVRTTRTTTTRRHADGRVETQTEERSEPVQPAGRAAAAARLDGAYGGGWGAPAPVRSSWGAAETAAPVQPRQQQQRPPEPRGSIASYFRRANASM